MKNRTFTVAEADRTIPLVAKIVEDVVRSYSDLSERAAEYKALRVRKDRTEDAEDRLNELKHVLARLSEHIDGFVEELSEIGAEMKDLEKGLVDFPAVLDDHRVCLCWRLGEDRVEFWHEVTEGFAGRKPLPVTVSHG